MDEDGTRYLKKSGRVLCEGVAVRCAVINELRLIYTVSMLCRVLDVAPSGSARSWGLRCRQKRRFKVTTDSRHSLPVAENLLGQKFEASAPNQIWLTDITYIPTGEGWLYLAGHKDLFTGEVVGYARGERMTKNLVSQSLLRAVTTKRPAEGLIHHSDRGSQYCA